MTTTPNLPSSHLASLKTVFVDKPENIQLLLKLTDQVQTLKRIILTKKLPKETEAEIRKKAKEVSIEISTFQEIEVKFQNFLFQ